MENINQPIIITGKLCKNFITYVETVPIQRVFSKYSLKFQGTNTNE